MYACMYARCSIYQFFAVINNIWYSLYLASDLRNIGEVKDVTVTFSTDSKQYILKAHVLKYKWSVHTYVRYRYTLELLNKSPAPTHVNYVHTQCIPSHSRHAHARTHKLTTYINIKMLCICGCYTICIVWSNMVPWYSSNSRYQGHYSSSMAYCAPHL